MSEWADTGVGKAKREGYRASSGRPTRHEAQGIECAAADVKGYCGHCRSGGRQRFISAQMLPLFANARSNARERDYLHAVEGNGVR